MKILLWSLRLIVFLLLFALAVKNSTPVTLRFFFDGEWQAPLSVVILLAFAAGISLGLSVLLSRLVRQRWTLGRCGDVRAAEPTPPLPAEAAAEVPDKGR